MPLQQTNEYKELSPHHTTGDIVGAYKSLVSGECLKLSKARNVMMVKLWQRNYYEHVIRVEWDYEAIVDYIQANPWNWDGDEEYST